MTQFAIYCKDTDGNPLAGVHVRLIEQAPLSVSEYEAGDTNTDGLYVTSDLPFPTPNGGYWYMIWAEYWSATDTGIGGLTADTQQQVTVLLNLYSGQGQSGGSGQKTLTINANPAECNHVIAINVGQQTSEVFASFPATFNFNPEDQINIEAFPQSGYSFDGWGQGISDNPYVWYPGDDVTVNAAFHWVGLSSFSTEQVINVPKPIVVFGNIFVPETDIVECKVHLGATKEVSSFEVKLQNWGRKYSQSGWLPIQLGASGGIGICRIPYNPNVRPMISLKVEHIEYQSTDTETYALISGRCWGERLFRRTVTKKYLNCKGETIVKDLLDNYVGLSHTRNGYELVENTSTTYTELDYSDTPVWDILQYIAESADYNGVIGFDFRVAPDGRFEFFRKNSRSVVCDLTDSIEESDYSKDISAVRNKITIYGAPDKSYPLSKEGWTEALSCGDGTWTATIGEVSLDITKSAAGTSCIKVNVANNYAASMRFTFNAGKEADAESYPEIDFFSNLETAFRGTINLVLFDDFNRSAGYALTVSADLDWHQNSVGTGSKNADKWVVSADFNWAKIRMVQISCPFNGVGSGSFWVDVLYFGGKRYSNTVENAVSENLYGLREYVDIDEELYSDNECALRAQALLKHMKDPAERLTVKSTVIDYGATLILAGDKVHAELPNENVDGDFRVISAEYSVDGETQELEITLELGRETVLLADYMYALKSKINKVNRLKVAT